MRVDNPYSDMCKVMQRQGAKDNPPSIQIASVVAPPPNLVIKIGELQVDKNNIYIADYLLADYQREISIPESVATGTMNNTIVADHGAHTHTIKTVGIADVTVRSKDTLLVGDYLAVMPTLGGQTYIILAKLVRLDG